MNLNEKIVCSPISVEEMSPQQVIGSDDINAHLIVRSSKNEELLYLDGACGPEPIFIGITKSRGDQTNKLPVEAGDFLGGVQVYARTAPGDSLGYRYEQTPLVSAIQFKVSDEYQHGKEVLSDLIIGLTGTNGMSIKLKVDHAGNLKVASTVGLGNLTITDKEVSVANIDQLDKKFIKITYLGQDYAMPIFRIIP